VKRSKNKYNDKKIFNLLKVRKFIIKYIQNLDTVLADLKRAKAIISVKKLKFCMTELKIVRYAYNINGRYSDFFKILKILNWRKCDNITEVKAFIKIYEYYRI
jgi:hypothetical protein